MASLSPLVILFMFYKENGDCIWWCYTWWWAIFELKRGFRVWRGKGKPSSAQLAIRLIDSLPIQLSQAYRFQVLADTAFGSVEFLKAMRKRRYPLVVGVPRDRKLSDGRQVRNLATKGQQVRLDGFDSPVTISWLYLKRNGKLEKRFVLSTRPLKASTITWWGRRRWSIEGFFKTSKHRFGLHRFGQQSLQGVYRWFILSWICFVLAHWVYLSTGSCQLPDWGAAATATLEILLPQVVISNLLIDVERRRPLLQAIGLDLQLVELQI